MHIEIKDLQTNKTLSIEEKGAKLGREKGRSDLAFPDKGVSGLHAKISCLDAKWFVEDMKSSNGTFVDDEKITAPALLSEGTRFRLYHYAFEVVAIAEDDSNGATAVFSPDAATRQVVRDDVKKSSDSAADDEEAAADIAPPSKTEAVVEDEPKPVTASRKIDEEVKKVTAPPPVDSGAPAFDKAAFMSDFGQAIAHYMAAIPALLFAFKPKVDASINEQKFPAMPPLQLIAWAAPPLLLGMIVAQLTALILMIVIGHVAIVSFIIGLLVGTAIMGVVAIVVGYIFHPLLGWLVRVLKGTSDEKTRSNYFVLAMTGTGLVAVINGIGALFLIIPVPFIGIVPVVLSCIGGLISLYILYRWFEFFQVAKWVLIVIMVLGALTALNALRGAWGVVSAHAATSRVSRAAADANAQIAAATEAANAQMAAANAQIAAATATAQNAANAAANNAGDTAAAANAAANPAAANNALPPPAPPPSAPVAVNAAAPANTAQPAANTAAAPAPAPAPTPKAQERSDDYSTYVAHRTAIEQAIEKNPALLARDESIMSLYKQLHMEMQKAQQVAAKNKGKMDAVLYERTRDAEVYKATHGTVDALFRKIDK